MEGDWDYGYWRIDKKGKKTYYVRGTWAGKRFEFSTRCHTAAAALAEFKRFEVDPHGYRVGGQALEGFPLTAALVLEFLDWSKATKRNSPQWRSTQKSALTFWMKTFAGRSLKKLDLARDILEPLEKATDARSKIRVLKTFYAWLRLDSKYRIAPVEDPTFGRLKNLTVRAAQTKRKRWFTKEDHLALLERVESERWRLVLTVLAGTGWHVTEVHRFSQAGWIEGNVLVVKHKSDAEHRTRVTPQTLLAAEELRKGGGFSLSRFTNEIGDITNKLGIPVKPGAYRHSVAHFAIEAGHTREEVANFLGHDPETNRTFYSGLATPKKVPTLG